MSVVIDIDAPHLLPDLVAGLRDSDCSVVPISSHSCRVVHRAESERQALYELRFFAKAWALAHGGVSVQLHYRA